MWPRSMRAWSAWTPLDPRDRDLTPRALSGWGRIISMTRATGCVVRTSQLARATLKGTPTEWAAATYKCAKLIDAHYIVAEKNFGGDMVKQVLTDYAATHPLDENIRDSSGEIFTVKVEHAAKSKETRAEATVAKYEQGTVTHVTHPHTFGDLSELEKQQCNWVPKSRGGKHPSPNDVDALVWAVREMDAKVKYEAVSASGRDVMKMVRRSQGRVAS